MVCDSVPSDRSLGAVFASLLIRRSPLLTPRSVPSVSFSAFPLKMVFAENRKSSMGLEATFTSNYGQNLAAESVNTSVLRLLTKSGGG